MHLTENLQETLFWISVASNALVNFFFRLRWSKPCHFSKGGRNIIGLLRTIFPSVESVERYLTCVEPYQTQFFFSRVGRNMVNLGGVTQNKLGFHQTQSIIFFFWSSRLKHSQSNLGRVGWNIAIFSRVSRNIAAVFRRVNQTPRPGYKNWLSSSLWLFLLYFAAVQAEVFVNLFDRNGQMMSEFCRKKLCRLKDGPVKTNNVKTSETNSNTFR